MSTKPPSAARVVKISSPESSFSVASASSKTTLPPACFCLAVAVGATKPRSGNQVCGSFSPAGTATVSDLPSLVAVVVRRGRSVG